MNPESEDLEILADAVLDGRPLDWPELESTANPEALKVIRQLRVIADIAGIRRRAVAEAPEWWGHLKVEEWLGAGAFGEVFRAWDSRLEREVALKLLHSDRDPAVVLREARLLARIRHPNIVTVYDAAEFGERAGFWMELVRGQTLEQDVRERGPFAVREVLRLGIELCGALAAVHAAGLLHRDVKAQNVIRDAAGRFVLMDFGACDELTPGDPASRQPVGTPLYLAPEVLSGGVATPLSEIYSLGVLLFRVAAGTYPVSGATIDELRLAHDRGLRRTLAYAMPGFPRDLARVIDRALEPDPTRRIPDAAEMGQALDRLERRLLHAGRRRILLAAAVLAPVLAAFAFLPVTRPWRQGLLRRAGLSGGSELQFTQVVEQRILPLPGMLLLGAVSMDDRLLSFADMDQGLAVRDLVSGEDRVLVKGGAEGDHAYHSWPAPDSSQVAYSWYTAGCKCMELRLVGAGGGQPRVLVHDEETAELFLGGWTADLRQILALQVTKSGEHRMELVSTTDGAVRVLKSSPDLNIDMNLSPDGRFVAYDSPSLAAPGVNSVRLLSTDGAVERPLLEDSADNGNALWTPDGNQLVYTSDRSGAKSLWRLPVTRGQVAGTPTLVRKDLGRITAVSLTSSGSLYYREQSGIVDVYTARIDLQSRSIVDGPRQIVSASPGSNLAPDWSWDGRFLGYLSITRTGGRLLTYQSTDTGAAIAVPFALSSITMLRWAPGGRHALLQGSRGPGGPNLYLVDLHMGSIDTLIENENFGWPVWDEDGRNVYLVLGPPRKSIVKLETRTHQRHEIHREKRTIMPALARSADGRWLGFGTSGEGQTVLTILPIRGGGPVELVRSRQPLRVGDFAGNYLLYTKPADSAADEAENELWAAPINGAEPFSLGLRMNGLRAVRVHPDGRTVALTAGTPKLEFGVLQNLLVR